MVHERLAGSAFTGLMALLVGAWGAICVYIGPYFDFRPVASDAWSATFQAGLLHLLPGLVGAAAGLMLLVMGPARRAVPGRTLILPAALLVAAGAWFVIGPSAWPVFESGTAFMPTYHAGRDLLNAACSSYAPGLLLMLAGGMALKSSIVPPIAVREADPMTPAEAEPVNERTDRRTTGGRATDGRTMEERAIADREVTDRTATGEPTTVERHAADV
ncbi:MAG TPA: hypothetical protein VFH70_05345 [Acidimicrobiales bacterium]|nr:hypothetical protein [Acidimicrobiales bacterium]